MVNSQTAVISNNKKETEMRLNFSNSISITIGSWLIGMLLNELIKNKSYYDNISNFNFIKSENINRKIGLGFFKWIVRGTFMKYLNQKLKLKGSTDVSKLKELRNEMTYSEISHLIAFIFVIIVVVFEMSNGRYLLGIEILIVNIFLNLYPSLLQQNNKRRIDNLIEKV